MLFHGEQKLHPDLFTTGSYQGKTDATQLNTDQRLEVMHTLYKEKRLDQVSAIPGIFKVSTNLVPNIMALVFTHGGAAHLLQKTMNQVDPSLNLKEDGIYGPHVINGLTQIKNQGPEAATRLSDTLQLNVLRYLLTAVKDHEHRVHNGRFYHDNIKGWVMRNIRGMTKKNWPTQTDLIRMGLDPTSADTVREKLNLMK